MAITFTTWTGTKGAVEPKTVTRPALSGYQVFFKTTHSGVCGTEIHYHYAGIGLGGMKVHNAHHYLVPSQSMPSF
jgi:D-arabinose 1-dehydrogenase-like Zn-dependent alcohol dehydrogenase